MAPDIRLRVDDTSAQDVSLNSSGVRVLENYPMETAEINQTSIQLLGDGDTLSVPTWQNVTESIPLLISDSSDENVAGKIRSIERLLDLARQGSLGNLDGKVYLRLQFDHDTEAWRSQILAARLEVTEVSNQIWRNYARVTLIITRRYYWETEALQDIAITSGVTTTPTTGYATIYNADDSSSTNQSWWQIDAAQVQGSLPTPPVIRIKNTSGATRAASTIYLGNYVFTDHANVDPIFRSEDADFSDTTPGTTEQDIYYWDLSSHVLVDAFKGKFGRFVVVWSDPPAITTLVRAALLYRAPSPQVTIALGENMLNNPAHYVIDLGALPIPPAGWVSGMGDRLYLALKAKAASGTDTLGVDWLQIFPSGAGTFRVLQAAFSLALSSNNEIVDDGPNGATYVETTTGEKLPIIRPLYDPIHLWPNRTQRLRLLISGGFSMEASNQWAVDMSYRPRRLSF